MAPLTFAARLDEMLGMIERALTAIEQGSEETDLRSLQKLLQELLLNCMFLLERNPGIEAAAVDLSAAASVFIRDTGQEELPLARKLRLFREARQRFRDRLKAARPSEHGTKIVWRHHKLLLSA